MIFVGKRIPTIDSPISETIELSIVVEHALLKPVTMPSRIRTKHWKVWLLIDVYQAMYNFKVHFDVIFDASTFQIF